MLVWERMGQLRGNSLRPFCGLQHLANDKVYILHISYILCMYEGAGGQLMENLLRFLCPVVAREHRILSDLEPIQAG